NVVDVDTNVPTSISLVVDDSDAAVSTDDQQTVKDALDDEHNKEEVLYFDAELVKNENGNETTPQPKTPVTITIELPSSLLNIDENVIRVFEIVHVKQDGSTETLPATLNGSQLSFTTGSFSPFAVVYKDKEKESATITLRAGAISLKGQIGVDFKLDIPDELLNDDTKIIITNTHQSSQDASSTLVFKASDYELEPSTNRKIYSFYLPVRRMADDLNIHAEDKDGNRIRLVTGSGVDYTDTGFTYSGLTYIHNQLNKDTTPENLKSFLRNLENFSNAARILFGYEAEGLSVDKTGFDDINAALLEGFDYSRSGSEPEGLKHKSVTLELKSETKIIHKFQLLEQDKSIDDYEFYVGDRKVTPFEEDGLYIIEVENIRARDLDEFYTVSVKAKGADDIAYSMDYAALSYAYRQLSKSGVSEDLINVVKSLYIYSNAANDYFENN
ncbi:MAG: hypothetical protein IIT44_05480, partial [Erysipelotrichaceae bacterium]|nr:hypothetical protein [Erysipelotrichaceae bacterium]